MRQSQQKASAFSRLLKFLRSLYGKQCGPDQTAPIEAVCSGSTLFASILNSPVMPGNYLQLTTFLGALRVKLCEYSRCTFLGL